MFALDNFICCGNEFVQLEEGDVNTNHKCCFTDTDSNVVDVGFSCCAAEGYDPAIEDCCDSSGVYEKATEVCCDIAPGYEIYDKLDCYECCNDNLYSADCDSCSDTPLDFDFFCGKTQCTNLKSIEIQIYLDHVCPTDIALELAFPGSASSEQLIYNGDLGCGVIKSSMCMYNVENGANQTAYTDT